MSATLTIDRHAALHREILLAERMASIALATMQGKTASQVAAEVSARAIASLRDRKDTRNQ